MRVHYKLHIPNTRINKLYSIMAIRLATEKSLKEAIKLWSLCEAISIEGSIEPFSWQSDRAYVDAMRADMIRLDLGMNKVKCEFFLQLTMYSDDLPGGEVVLSAGKPVGPKS